MRQTIKIGLTLASVVGIASIGLLAPWIAQTDGPPGILTVRNEADAADCTIAFEKGAPWLFKVDRNQSQRKFFLTGTPEISSIDCKSGERLLQANWEFIGCFVKPHTLVVTNEDAFWIAC